VSYCSSSRYHIYIFWGDEWDESNIHKSQLFWGENRGSPKNTGFLQSLPQHTRTKEKLVQYTELHFANCPIDLDVHPISICHPEQWVCRYPGITPQYARKTRCGWHGKHLKRQWPGALKCSTKLSPFQYHIKNDQAITGRLAHSLTHKGSLHNVEWPKKALQEMHIPWYLKHNSLIGPPAASCFCQEVKKVFKDRPKSSKILIITGGYAMLCYWLPGLLLFIGYNDAWSEPLSSVSLCTSSRLGACEGCGEVFVPRHARHLKHPGWRRITRMEGS